MSIKKNDRIIDSLEEWRKHAGPKRPDQWKDGRSAKEVARAWLGDGTNALPEEVEAILSGHQDFGPVLAWDAEPEVKLRFDDFPGEPRNSDIVVDALDTFGSYLLAVEAKADEPYGDTLVQTLLDALERRQDNPRSNGIARVEQLTEALLGTKKKNSVRIGDLRYQLLTACAGALCEAERKRYSRSIMLVHEFVTSATADEKHIRNEADLENFVNRLSDGVVTNVPRGQLCGPFFVPGEPLLRSKVALYIGKVTRNLRTNAA
jgi:hypothetical protein